jgi:hypothetical protein
MKFLLIFVLCILSIPSFASDPWDSLLISNKKVTVSFKNQSAHVVNSWLTKMSGIPVLMDPSFNKPISMNSATSVSLSQAFKMYNQMLNFYNYEITKENKWLVIKPIIKKIEPSKEQLTNQNTIQEEQNAEIKVIKLKNNNSSNVARLINELFSTPSFKIEDFIWRTNLNDTIRPGR